MLSTADLGKLIKFISYLADALPKPLKNKIKYYKTFCHYYMFGHEKRKNEIERKLLFNEELAGAGYPVKEYDVKQIKILSNSFTLESVDSSFQFSGKSLYRIPEFVDAIIENDAMFHVVNGESGSGKTIFGLTLSLITTQRGISLGNKNKCRSIYLSPTDFDSSDNESLEIAKHWAKILRDENFIIIIDALNESLLRFDTIEAFVNAIRTVKPSKLRIILLYRHLGSTILRNFTTRITRLCGEADLKYWEIPFNLHDVNHYKSITSLLSDSSFKDIDISKLLRDYQDKFPRFKHTRGTASELLKYYVRHNTSVSGPIPRISPWKLVFDNILGDISNEERFLALCYICYKLLESGRFTDWVSRDEASRYYRDLNLNFNNDIDYLKKLYSSPTSELRVRTKDTIFRFPDEMHIHALAAIWITHTILKSNDSISELSSLKGRSTFDNTARFILPACDYLSGDSNKILKFIVEFGNSPRASYSFCAQFLATVFDQIFKIDDLDNLKRNIFENLVISLDEDRGKKCADSIDDDMPQGPNPVVDQLFEVSYIYGDDAVSILINSILLDDENKTATARSQGAYLLLDWLEKVKDRDSHIIPDGKADYLEAIVNGIEKLETWNMHIRFHVIELLEFMIDQANRLQQSGNNPDWTKSLSGLTDKYAKLDYGDHGKYIDDIYKKLNNILSNWSLSMETSLSTQIEPLSAALLTADLDGIIKNISNIDNTEINEKSFDYYLENMEVSLGLARREYLTQPSDTLISHILNTENSEYWIIRWWGFYNLIIILSRQDNPRLKHIDWTVKQLFREAEPLGLKKRQCGHLLNYLLFFSGNVREEIKKRIVDKFSGISNECNPGYVFRDSFLNTYRDSWSGDADQYLGEYFLGVESILDNLNLAQYSGGLVDRRIVARV